MKLVGTVPVNQFRKYIGMQNAEGCLYEQVAYVLGQLQDKASTEALVNTLKDVTEHPMVRHEAAEALGSIAGTCFSMILFIWLFIKITAREGCWWFTEPSCAKLRNS
jgi:hypothetical protein